MNETNITSAAPILHIENMTKLYSNGRGVRDINLDLYPGDIVGLLGPNGSGKTTIMKVVVGLCHAQSGVCDLFGHPIEREYEQAAAQMSCLIESPALYENLSAEKNLMLAARVRGLGKQDALNALRMVHLNGYEHDKVGRFSLGMKQRLGLAIAMLGEPKLIVLDEPINGLDIEGIVETREMIVRAAREKGCAFLIASHLAAEIERTCNKVAVVHEGELFSFTTMDEALRRSPTLEDYFLEEVRKKRGGAL